MYEIKDISKLYDYIGFDGNSFIFTEENIVIDENPIFEIGCIFEIGRIINSYEYVNFKNLKF